MAACSQDREPPPYRVAVFGRTPNALTVKEVAGSGEPFELCTHQVDVLSESFAEARAAHDADQRKDLETPRLSAISATKVSHHQVGAMALPNVKL